MSTDSFTLTSLKTALDEAVDHAQAHVATHLKNNNRVRVSTLSMTLSLTQSAADQFSIVDPEELGTHYAQYNYAENNQSTLQIKLLNEEAERA